MKILIAEDDVFFCKLLHKLLSVEFEVKNCLGWHRGMAETAREQCPTSCRAGLGHARHDWPADLPGAAGESEDGWNLRDPPNSQELGRGHCAGLRSGADDYVTKPIQPEELRARVAVGRRIIELEASVAAQAMTPGETLEREKFLQNRLISVQDLGQPRQVGGFFRNPR
jgi:hypothetical protein